MRQVVVDEPRPAHGWREHGIAEGLLLRWRREYAARGEAAFSPSAATGTAALERKGADLARFRGHLAVENAALKKGGTPLPARSGTR
ncbi:MAG: hypothetical protein ACRD2Z_05410 [Thermoanaerobaculia bacterium]